jgi:hypothetical protein
MSDLAEVTNFIVSLSEDPAKARRFRDDPQSVIGEAGVSQDTAALLMSSPLDFLREVFVGAKPKPVVQTQVNTQTNVNTNVKVTTTTNVNKSTAITVTLVIIP